MIRRTIGVVVLALAMAVSACTMNQEQSGAVLGGAVGAAAGSAVGKGTGRTVAIILGALVGSQVGANIGRHMDEMDRIRTSQAMEYNRSGQSSAWRNPDTQVAYNVTPTKTYETAQGPCREFTMDAEVGGEPNTVYGTACRQADGTWKIVK
ncbi:MAG: RT0821/Lpp0805 family surface protein [Nevskiales bacterium]|nr:RT0821/Lpp0805 family surface protein [Nevskiales bacterium]